MPSVASAACELCDHPGGRLLWEDALCRVVRVGASEGTDYPGFCRVIWHAHQREMTDLSRAERRHLMAVVYATEAAVRGLYQPHKINLASFGNLVPHLHWHVIPRYTDDRHFPNSVWSEPQRDHSPARPDVSDAVLKQAIALNLSEDQGGGIT
jgi:diadenosine tetraphosphate (Ap4A) HIT family hydrolase